MELGKLKKLDDQIGFIASNDPSALLSFLKEFKSTIEVLEKDFTREEIINRILNIRRIVSDSPLMNRAQNWPKGYQGDFETIDHIISQKNKAIPGTLGYTIENFFLSSAICKQHINKVKHQAQLISNALTCNPHSQIISIGCGTSEDLKINTDKIAKSEAEITLVDVDIDALNYSLRSLEMVKEHVKIVHGNIYRIIRTIKEKFDLIIIGGVFDYLSDKAIVNILSALKDNISNEGKAYFTNIKQNNPFRIHMEYLSNWILIERSDSEILNLLKESGCEGFFTTIQTDDTDLTHLVEIGKP